MVQGSIKIKMDQRSNVKTEIIFGRQNRRRQGEHLEDIGVDKDFLNRTPSIQN